MIDHNACQCQALFEGNCSWSLARRVARRHPTLRRLFNIVGPLQTKVPRGHSTNEAILRVIIGQMLSSKAASAIRTRLMEAHGSAEGVFRWAAKGRAPRGPGGGLSLVKRKALRAWWQYCQEGANDPAEGWRTLTNAQLRDAVSQMYGLGSWSADILGIFLMGRLGIWPVGDVGLDRARAMVFRGVGKREFFEMIDGHESLVAVYLWEVLNRDLTHHFRGR